MDINIQDLNAKFSAIDKALTAAKARKASKEAASSDGAVVSGKIDDTTKATVRAAKLAEREAKKQELASAREARRVAKAAQSKEPAHMKKLDNAASKLPKLNEEMQLLFNETITNFNATQITALALHLQHFNRVKATERALGQKVEAGSQVRIIGGYPKFIGMTGTVSKAQRIRCYVSVSGVKRDVYCFTSDVELVTSALPSTGTDG